MTGAREHSSSTQPVAGRGGVCHTVCLFLLPRERREPHTSPPIHVAPNISVQTQASIAADAMTKRPLPSPAFVLQALAQPACPSKQADRAASGLSNTTRALQSAKPLDATLAMPKHAAHNYVCLALLGLTRLFGNQPRRLERPWRGTLQAPMLPRHRCRGHPAPLACSSAMRSSTRANMLGGYVYIGGRLCSFVQRKSRQAKPKIGVE